MTTIERSIELDVPASTAYDAWTQFERFPTFMEDVESVEQIDDRHLRWRARVGGRVEEWSAEITEQIPDKRIAWTSEDGAQNAGVVTFHRLSDERSRVMLQLGYELGTLAERVGDALGFLSHSVERDLRGFKEFVEREGDRIAGWRGRVPAPPDSAQKAAGEGRGPEH
jgi:uncharacterized membrane protein